MKVFGGCYDGRSRVIVAAKTKKEAHGLISKAVGGRLSYYSWDQYTSETGNDTEVMVATSKPGVVFSAPHTMGKDFKEVF